MGSGLAFAAVAPAAAVFGRHAQDSEFSVPGFSEARIEK
jgi:hypothetical protein